VRVTELKKSGKGNAYLAALSPVVGPLDTLQADATEEE